MPKSSKQELKTKAAYNKRPEVQDRRVDQNRARRQAIAAGKAKVGDNTNVDHKRMLDKGGSDSASNTRVVSEKFNKGWRGRNPEAYTKTKKR
jgi:hypothetical protein